MNKIILASKSPRRTEILTANHIEHIVIPSNSEEKFDKTHSVEKIVEEIAYSKTIDIANLYPDDLVIGADTIVTIDNEILGKPKDEQDAIRMFKMLEGRTHQVITGVVMIKNHHEDIFHVTTDVKFSKMTDEQILEYIHNDYVYDKAGAYAIQSDQAWFVEKIEGSYFNVMGLPIETVLEKIKNIG